MLLEQESGQKPTLVCYRDEENIHRACTNGYLTTANQRELREANRALV